MSRRKKSVKRTPTRTRPPVVTTLPATPPPAPPEPPETVAPPQALFPIVGIGFSAGGLEALEDVFRHLPVDMGAAFIVVSHQHVNQTTMLPEIISRWTVLPILPISDGLSIQPNHIYLPPPGSSVAILHGVCHLIETAGATRPRLPIDYFLCSLAGDQQKQAIGIILSGTGTDGSIGLKTIRAEAGLTMAQEPRSAKFAGMPQNAIAMGVVDIICSAAEMGARLHHFLHHRTVLPLQTGFGADDKRELNKILIFLRDRIGNDFSLYKTNTILRRLERRMSLHQIKTLADYAKQLYADPGEAQALFKDLLIGVTAFFRDPSIYDVLQKGLPQLLDGKPEGYTVRGWVPACSTGEEAYSLAMLLCEYRTRQKRKFTIQLFATDIDREAIDKARHGLYPEGIENQISEERLHTFFVKEDSHYRVKPELRDCLTFAVHNLLRDAPFTKLDLLSCRNFLIYLHPETQAGLIPLWHYALKPHGLLILGTAETIDGVPTLFKPLERKSHIFSRNVGRASLPVSEMRIALAGEPVVSGPVLPDQHHERTIIDSLHKILFDNFVPPTVFVTGEGEVCYIQGRTGDYLEPAPGKGNTQLMDMVRPELRLDLLAAFQLARKQGRPVVRKNLRLQTRGGMRRVTITVTPISQPSPVNGLMMIVFDVEAGRAAKASARLLPVRRGTSLELELAQQRLQRTNTDLQFSNEEFKSSNEELQSTNEELQSTNEELETTKEELQSLNEELATLNSQLQMKFEEAANANDDLKNLVNSTEVATIFLDTDLRIKRFTPQAKRVSKVIASDIGRQMGDIVSTVHGDSLLDDVHTVLRTLVFKEREVQAEDGHWYLLRIAPYRTSRNVIDGVVLTYQEITAYKQAISRAESIVDQVPIPLILLDTDFRVVMANRSFYQVFACTRGEIERHPLDRILHGRFNHPELRTALETRFLGKTGVDGMELELESLPVKDGQWRATLSSLARDGKAPLMLLALQQGPDTHPSRIDSQGRRR